MTSQVTPTQLQIFGGDGEEAAQSNLRHALLLALATLVSLAILWFATRNVVLVGSCAGAMIAGWGLVDYVRRTRPAEEAEAMLPPDWSITHAAAQLSNAAIAISDRAGRLVCANDHFTKAFAGLKAPPDLGVDEMSRELLVAAGRAAWRDGNAQVDAITKDSRQFSVKVARAGTADEYLLWRLAPIEQLDIESRAIELITGRIGRAMADSGVMAVSICPDGRISAANAAFVLRATGTDLEPITGREFASYMRMDEKGSIFFEREGRRGLPIRLLHVPLAEDRPDGASLLLAVDEEAAKAERGLALAHVEQLLSTLPLGLALVDRDGRFLFANDAFARVINIAPEELPPYPGDLVIAEDKAAVLESIRRYGSGSANSGDIAVRLKEQPDEVIALSIAGVRGLGEAAVLLGLKDNSEETKLKRQVAQQTKMESIGQLAGGVAHDFNNILTAIIGYCDLILLRHQPGDSDYDDIQQIKNNSNRAASLTRQLLAFSRQQTLRPQVLQLPDIVSESSILLKRLLGETVRLEVNHGRAMGAVRADPGQLEQVIINLSLNARDAMPKGGVVHISTKSVSQDEVRAMASDILPIGDYVLLSVEDSGTGIPRENLAKIFEPFFTTKEVGKGTGLGLSTVYGIVKQSGGFIFAESEVGQGTRFDIFLPVHVGEAPAEPTKREFYKPKDLWGNGRILIVEDEDMVRAVAERALARQGYVVETACDGEEALALFADGKRYDLVVSDVVMPNMDGPTMARNLRGQFGDIRLLFMSGYAEEQLRQTISLDNVSFLPKPFSVQQIAEAVHDALAREE